MVQASPSPDIANVVKQLNSAKTILDTIPRLQPVKPSGQSQQNCFNQTYSGSTCPQSTIETFMSNLNIFKNANDTFITCLNTTNNNQYSILLGKLQNIQLLINQL